MLAVSLALAACVGWGVADFLGGLKSRTLPLLSVLMLSSLVGFGLILGIVAFRGDLPEPDPRLLLAVAGGAASAAALLLLYRGFVVGSMAIVAPVSATGAVLPVVIGLASGESPTALQSAGMAAAVVGSVLASKERRSGGKGTRPSAGIGLALSAAVAIGAFFVIMDRASDADPYWAALILRLAQCLFLLPVLWALRPPLRMARVHLPAVAAIGMFDALASFAYTLATTRGMLSVVAVVGSLYPAVTVLLAVVVLRERPQKLQVVGVILALAGVGLISGG